MTVRRQSLKSWNMAAKIIGLVVYNVAWAEAYLSAKWHLDRGLTSHPIGGEYSPPEFV